MRLPAALLAALAFAAPSLVSAQAVLISELCDPKQNFLTDRFLEIYNAGAAPVDLTGWQLVAVGNSVDIFTWNLSGTIAPGEALVAGDATTVISFPVDFADEAWSASNSTWNGKVGDGARLLAPGAVLVDLVVATGTTFENEDYVRNDDILAPNTVYTPSEWTATPVELPTGGSPGTHNVAPPPPGPTIANVVTLPALPASGDTVFVSADVTDTTGATVVTVEMFWGTAPGSLPNQVAMSPSGGNTWTTDTAIPSQAPGTTVYYEIHATNDTPVTAVLGAQNYPVPWELTIAQIQGAAPVSPYDGATVITQGVVTAYFGSHFSVQDGTGAWSGLWAQSPGAVAVGDSVVVRGRVTEAGVSGYAGNTLLSGTQVLASAPAFLPAATAVSSTALNLEDYEGVLVAVSAAECTEPALGLGEWQIDDGSGTGRVGVAGYVFVPTLGTDYDVTGVATYTSANFKVEPRSAADVTWVADAFAPVIERISTLSDSTLLVLFSEAVEQATAETPGHYSIPGLTVLAAARVSGAPEQVQLTVSPMTAQVYTLTVTGVEDLFGNATAGAMLAFDYVETAPPAGYYDTAEGLNGVALQSALHGIILGHTVVAYADTWTSFMTTDDKPNGKVWDIYSDVPGGVPPYEYTFGVDQGGVGGVEGTGYNREHSWPQSWFNSLSPMNSDLFLLYPTDNYVNGVRGSDAFGVVGFAGITTLNGSKSGSSATPGYAGNVFEPIDEYKGDLARSYFYMSTRYYTEDAGWPGGPMSTGSQMLPWAIDLMLGWHAQDPVSQKELDRNGTIYLMQGNRNPFIDRPEFAALAFSPAVDAVVAGPVALTFSLGQNAPNPFRAGTGTAIRFTVPGTVDTRLAVYDAAGRLVETLVDGVLEPGRHEVRWDRLDRGGRAVASGVYFYRVEAGEARATRKMVILR